MVKYIEKYDKKALTLGIKEKIAVVIFFGLIIAIYFMFFHVDKTPYGYTEIPEALDTYLKDSPYYGNKYKGDKMIVFYYADKDPEYQYEKGFQDALESMKINENMQELYEFQPYYRMRNTKLLDDDATSVLKGEKLLKKTCRKFCIMNRAKKQAYFYFEPKSRDIQYLQSNLEKLEFWGMKLD